MNQKIKKVFLIRLDRIGDLVLTLPSDQHPYFRGKELHWMIPQGLEPICQFSKPERSFTSLSLKINFWNFLNLFLNLVKIFKTHRPDAVVIFFAPWWVALASFFAGVPLRHGRRSQWWSFLFLNSGLRQKRSQGDQHELQYNLDLISALDPTQDITSLEDIEPLQIIPPERPHVLSRHGLQEKKYVVVHAGMGGSARNWPLESYEKYIRELSKKTTVVMTGTPQDSVFLEPLKFALNQIPNIKWMDGQLNLTDLLTLLQKSNLVVVPSTGVAHLAAAVGAQTLGLYSPVRVQAPKRWAPLGPHVRVLVPEVNCPGHHSCLMKSCPHYDCWNLISPELVLKLSVGGDHPHE